MRDIGVYEEGLEIMHPKGGFQVIRLSEMDIRGANILKQEMLAAGGEAAISHHAVDFSEENTDVLVMGTRKQLDRVIGKLKLQPFQCKDAAESIEHVQENLDRRWKVPCGRYELDCADRTAIMGIINMTPDSFSGDGITGVEQGLERAIEMVEAGADILDIGGESTRPGSESVAPEDEIERVMPVIHAVKDQLDVPISLDSYKPEVVEKCLEAEVEVINDIFGGRDEKVLDLVADHGAGIVLMHMQGEPKNMQENPVYGNVVNEAYHFLWVQANKALDKGIHREKIIIDPGIGFGKTVEHNLELVHHLKDFRSMGFPVLIGHSRKSFIGKVLDLPRDQRVEGTVSIAGLASWNGADIVRVHDVEAVKRGVYAVDAVKRLRM